MALANVGMSGRRCGCAAGSHEPRFIVVTGGPGAGKTAVLELARRLFCRHVRILPEAAGIVYGGGFPRSENVSIRRAAQRAIYHVQTQLETIERDERRAAVVLCDRGTLDGAAYWPGEGQSFWADVGTTREAQIQRYAGVIHLRTPAGHHGYDHSNPLRIESPAEAAAIDARIANAWESHPRRSVIGSDDDFMVKASRAIACLLREVPDCCARIAAG